MPLLGAHSVGAPFTEKGETRCSARTDASRRTGEPPGKPGKAPQAVTPPACYQQVARANKGRSRFCMHGHLAVTESPVEGCVAHLGNSRLFNRPGQRRSSPEPRSCVRISQCLSGCVRLLRFPRQLLSPDSGLSRAKEFSKPERALPSAAQLKKQEETGSSSKRFEGFKATTGGINERCGRKMQEKARNRWFGSSLRAVLPGVLPARYRLPRGVGCRILRAHGALEKLPAGATCSEHAVLPGAMAAEPGSSRAVGSGRKKQEKVGFSGRAGRMGTCP